MIRKGDIYFVRHYNANPSKSGRPAVVLSGDTVNRDSDSVILAYLTARPRAEDKAFTVPIKFQRKKSCAVLNKLSSVSTDRLVHCAGHVSEKERIALECAVCKVLEL